MKRRDVLGLSLAAPVLLHAAPSGSLASYMLPRWETSKKYTLAFLEKMPEEHYSFRPVPEINMFAEQAAHIGEGNFLLASAVRGVPKPQHERAGMTHSALIAFVASSFDYGTVTLSALTDAAAGESVTFFGQKILKRELCFRMLDHVAHHRGQLVIYLRLKGIAPPDYAG